LVVDREDNNVLGKCLIQGMLTYLEVDREDNNVLGRCFTREANVVGSG
jgi:hypothetical protein